MRTHRPIPRTILPAGFCLIVCVACQGPSAGAPQPADHVLRAGDRLVVYDASDPLEQRLVVDVNPDGIAQLPLVGNQFLLGMSEADAADALTEEYREYFEEVRVTVEWAPGTTATH